MAGTVAVLFLACQGVAVVYARSLGAPQSSAAAAQESCHNPGQQNDTGAGDKICQSSCQSQLTSSSSFGANVFAVTDLPAITARLDLFVAVPDSALPVEPPLLRVEPPPLAILNCRLRN